MQGTLSDNAVRFINSAFPTFMVRADNENFLKDAEAIAEILNVFKPQPEAPQADTAPKEDNATSELQQ